MQPGVMDLALAKILMLSGSTLALLIMVFIISFVFWPAAVIKRYNWLSRHRLGLKVDYLSCGKYRFCYSHRGRPGGATPSVLLLHGFSLNKDMWLYMVKCLPKSQHVLCLDMPGHEGTSRTNAEDYCIEGQVKRIHQFVQSVSLNRRPFHLVGTSMGGNVAGVYAARFPAHLSGVTLICPAGLVFPTESVFIKRMKEIEKSQNVHDIPLIPSTPQEMEDMLKLVCDVRFKIPQQIIQGIIDVPIPNNAFYRKILQGLIDERIPNNDFYREAFLEIVGERSRHSLQDNLHLITAPLQVIWGKHDQVVDVSGVSVIQEVHPGCQVTLLDDCGHSVVIERPRKTAELLMDFLSAYEVNSNRNTLV